MPGKRIKTQQVKIYMESRREGKTQVTAAAKAGMSERTGRTIEQEQRSINRQRNWRTRKDPFASVWVTELVPRLEQCPDLSALTCLEYLQERYPGQYPDQCLRTLQRRVKRWKAEHGPSKEVMFKQDYPPGKQGLSDFTHLKGVEITVKGEKLPHILYHFRLRYSGWSHLKVVLGGESFTALTEGLQEALWRLGGSPQEHRTDSLAAAYKNLSDEAKLDVTDRYANFCEHYGMTPTRNNKGRSHENGAIESPHGHVKRRIEQALMLRESTDFDNVEAYQNFLDKVVRQHNARNAKALSVERPSLTPLPESQAADYTEVAVKVTSSSTICVKHSTYSVPSRLIGECLRVHVYDSRLVCYLGARQVCDLTRVHSRTQRARNIDYRHVYESLQRKPGAFRHSQIRDDLLPTEAYHQIWHSADSRMESQMACRYIVGCLALAAQYDCEAELSDYVISHDLPTLDVLRKRFGGPLVEPPQIQVKQHSLSDYDSLGGEICKA